MLLRFFFKSRHLRAYKTIAHYGFGKQSHKDDPKIQLSFKDFEGHYFWFSIIWQYQRVLMATTVEVAHLTYTWILYTSGVCIIFFWVHTLLINAYFTHLVAHACLFKRKPNYTYLLRQVCTKLLSPMHLAYW